MPKVAGHDDTRSRILAVAMRLFTSKGYAGTSIADITSQLGISKAALYHHFGAKTEILEELVAGPLAEFARLAERAVAEQQTPEKLLAALIDTTAATRSIATMISSDPSTQDVLNDRAGLQHAHELNDSLAAVLAGPNPTVTATVRAHAALAVAKQGTLALMGTAEDSLGPAQRDELLAAALRALHG
ncbi:TetR/AcrR family transcriptional regulator [Micromonospora sicca]|uniref:TetR/AcrR family transcriptional regulator n=1 Tax=Micromonospora sicca TaxID=2202420 RepID=A0A317DV46_9ACTN|nr:helix-turn-helix domain-containing protein [Micromonospora sp. 4G51]PWR16863.1 TetR/AcrR family transcriptional regulator [Micromonospora sp. 4G51]